MTRGPERASSEPGRAAAAPRLVVVDLAELESMIERAVQRGVEGVAHAPAPPSEWLDLDGAASLLGYSREYLRRRSEVPVHRVGRKFRYSRAELEAWMRQSREAG